MTLGEVLLWKQLKGKKLLGYDFDRQRPIDKYIVDFYCKELQLAIEIDGSSHHSAYAQYKDRIRQQRMEAKGVRFLRIEDAAVKNNMGQVVELIKDWVKENTHP